MSLYTGKIELGSVGADCRVPDAVWHFRQFSDQKFVPNYGVNPAFPRLGQLYDDGSAWATGLDYPGIENTPPIKLKTIYGDCHPTQIIFSTLDKFNRFNVLEFQAILSGTWAVQGYWQFGNAGFLDEDNFYIQMDSFSDDYDILQYGEWPSDQPWWPSYNFGPGGRCTWLVSIDPSYGLDSERYYPAPGTTNMGGWPAYFNGIQPKNVTGTGLLAVYGSNNYPSGYGCNLAPLARLNDDYFLLIDTASDSFGGRTPMLGAAIFRDRPMMTYEEFMCWHMEYDWLEDPGFI